MATSRVLQRLYSLDASSPDFLRNLYCLIQYDEKEQYLTSLRGSGLARLVDFLDDTLNVIPATDDVARECLSKLQAICGHHATLPSSYIVSGQIARVGGGPVDFGAIADVWEGTYHDKKVSIKSLRVRTKDKETLKSFFKEAIVWKRLNHPNIVPFIGVTTDPLQVVSEWMPNGTLMEFIKENPGANLIGLLLDVAEGLDCLHANDIIHGNLNGSSILVDSSFHARLTDFEFPSIVRGTSSAIQGTGYATVLAAPEILEGADTITLEADVFAFGMLVVEVFTGTPPFSEFAAPVVISKIISGERPARPQEAQELGLKDSVWSMVVRCWGQDHTKRPTMTEVVGLLHESLVSSLSIEADLSDFFQACKIRDKDGQETKAQEFADRLDEVLDNADLHQQKRKHYLRHLQKLCGTSDILPSSFTLSPASVEREATHFASGGYSDVYRGTFDGNPVVIKILKVSTETDREKLHRLLVKEVVAWKWLRHENILPFVGVMSEPSLSIASERMENGNIMDFIKAHNNYNRLLLLVGAVSGLEYLHERNIVHGDLKGVNILIDSERRARLADFGLAAIVDESTSRTTAAAGAMKGTMRWMAPELLYPELFGFTGKFKKQLPSKDTDIYAIGMTIFEVLTGDVPFANDVRNETIMFRVVRGDRPDRPSPGFSDRLWELLKATWVAQHAQQPRERLLTSNVVDRLKECVDDWGKSILPLMPERGRASDEEEEEEEDEDDYDTIMQDTMASDF